MVLKVEYATSTRPYFDAVKKKIMIEVVLEQDEIDEKNGDAKYLGTTIIHIPIEDEQLQKVPVLRIL